MNSNILVISQDESIRLAFKSILSPMNCTVHCVCGLNESRKFLSMHSVNIVFLDSHAIGSFSILLFIKTNTCIPVIIIAESGETFIKELAYEYGADDFVTRPVEAIELKIRTRSHLNMLRSGRINEYPKTGLTDLDICQDDTENNKLFSVGTIKHLVRVSALRDENMCAHAIRVAYYSAAIARKLGATEIATHAIFSAASMHDIGKIVIPDCILLKPARLDYDEMKVVKTHPNHGHFILKDSDTEFVRLAESVANCHHERWDGSGYPNNVKEDDIPVEARIVAIADVFDALVSKRCYKEPFSLDQTYQMIQEGNGILYDSKIVEAFFDIQPEILSIREKFNDEYVYRSIIEESQSCIPLYP